MKKIENVRKIENVLGFDHFNSLKISLSVWYSDILIDILSAPVQLQCGPLNHKSSENKLHKDFFFYCPLKWNTPTKRHTKKHLLLVFTLSKEQKRHQSYFFFFLFHTHTVETGLKAWLGIHVYLPLQWYRYWDWTQSWIDVF